MSVSTSSSCLEENHKNSRIKNSLEVTFSQWLSEIRTNISRLLKFESKSACIEPRTVTKGEFLESLLNRLQVAFNNSNKDKLKTVCNVQCTDRSCEEQREKYLATLSDKDNTIDTQQRIIKRQRKELKILKEYQENTDEVFKTTKTDIEQILLERDELKNRLENLLDTVENLTKQHNGLLEENTWLMTKLQDIKIKFKELENISLEVSSVLNPLNHTTYDIEKENETLKENLKKVEHDKQRVEQELSITLNKLMKSRQECQEICKQYNVETSTIADGSPNKSNKYPAVGQYNNENRSQLQHTGQDNTPKTLVESSTNERYRNITSEKNIYQITANNVYMIEKSTVNGDVVDPLQVMNN